MNLQRIVAAIVCLLLCGHPLAQAQEMDKELSKLADKLAVLIKDNGKKKVAVIDFTDLQGGGSELGKYIAEELTVGLVMAKRDFSVLDRANLRRVLAEHKLTATGLIDPENAKKLGQFAGVDAIILGTIIPKGTNSIGLTAKVITIDTAEIVAATKAEFKSDEQVQQLASKSAATGKADESLDDKTEVSKVFGDLRVELQPLRIVNQQNFLLTMTLKNQNAKKSIGVALESEPTNMLKSRITDGNGNEFASYGGNSATGIEYASYYKDAYRKPEFSPATEIKPTESITVTVRFFAMNGIPPRAGTHRIHLQLLVGQEFGSSRSSVSVATLLSKISAN